MKKNEELIYESFEKISSRISQLPNRRGTVCPLYLEGGASLFLNQVKNTFRDVDWFIPERWLKYNEIQRVKPGTEDIHVNTLIEGFTFNPTFDTQVMKIVEHNDIKFEMHCMNPAMVYLMKLDTGREKDMRDIELISRHVKPEDIINAINSCIPLNKSEVMINIASQTLSEITCHYLLDSKNYKKDITKLINMLELNQHDKEEIALSFGVTIDQEYKSSKDQWRGTQRRPERNYGSDMNI